ncbi:MAG: hypothetical protein NTY53_08240 [Kiritimatiellaeota bacterium]|nr:hypothetical protein [Kiritimatiellota bacterium]
MPVEGEHVEKGNWRGATLFGPTLKALAKETTPVAPEEIIDPAHLRPHPDVRIAAAFLGFPRPYWLGWPGTTYDLVKHEQEHREWLAKSTKQLGLTTDLAAKPLQDVAGVEAWIKKLQTEKPHGVLVMLQHIHTWTWAQKIAQETGIPLIVFAPVGTAFTGHVGRASRVPGLYALSTLDWSAVEEGLRMIRAKRLFEETRLLWIRGKESNETVLERLGTKVRAVPRDTFNLTFDKQAVTDEVRDVANDMRRHARKVVEPKRDDMLNSARCFVTAKRLLAGHKANALSMDCLGMVSSRLMPTPPCFAWTLLQDRGVTAGCEADLWGAMSLMLSSYLLDRPGYMNDPVPETAHNTLITSHCTSGTRLSGFDKPPAPYILRNHSESALGVSTQVLWPDNEPVTLMRFTSASELIIDTGKVVVNVDTPPAGGCRTSVELRMDNIEDCRDVLGFHQVVTLGDHRRALRGFCELYGIKPVHSPEHSTFAERANT